MLNFLKTRLRAFRDEQRGSAAVEAAIIFPVLFWAYAATFTYYEAYRAQATAEKAAYAVSDMISRETLEIDGTYISNMRNIFRDLSGLTNSETALRITVMRWDQEDNRFYIDWAKRRGDIPRLRNRDIKTYNTILPTLVDNERIILVETSSEYDPAFDVGLASREIETFVFTRPRYTPQLLWASSN